MNKNGIVTVLLMSGFSFFEKNLFNMWFILLGTFIYSRVVKEKFSKHIVISLLSTTLAPIAGTYGFIPGLAAGFIHSAVILHTV